MNIYKVSFISSIETTIKLVTGFIVLKLLAFYSGPEGVGKFGQFQSFLTIITVLISGGFVTGLVRFVSESSNIQQATCQRELSNIDYIRGAFSFGFFVSNISVLVLLLAAYDLSIYIFGTNEYVAIFYLLAPSLFFIVIYQVAISYLNGVRKIKEMVTIKLVSSLVLLFIGALLIYLYGLYGSLIGLLAMQLLAGLFAIKVLRSLPSFSWHWFKPSFNRKVQLNLSSYWLMSLMSLISSALVIMLIRKHIVAEDSWASAGIWDAMWKISELSMLLVTTALTVYYVPMLSKATSHKEQLSLLIKVIALGLVVATSISIMIYILREFVVSTLFSMAFIEVAELIKFQLVASVTRIVGWVIGFHMLIKARPAVFLISELIFGLTFYFLSISLFDIYGMLGLTYAFLANNILFLLVGAIYLTMYFKKGMFANG